MKNPTFNWLVWGSLRLTPIEVDLTLKMCIARWLLQHRVESNRYLLQCLEVFQHSQISQCSGSIIPNFSPLEMIPFKAVYTPGSKM